MTLTTDELRQIVETDHVQCGDAAAMARELLANREAQPVGVMNIGSETCSDYLVAWTKAGAQLGKGVHWLYTAPPAPASEPIFFIEVEGDDWINAGRIPGSTFDFNNLPDGVNKLYAAPPAPAPAVPEEAKVGEMPFLGNSEQGYVRGWNDCRAAMLAQPVSCGYKLPEGFKLMPLEMTDEIGEAIAMEARCCGGIALCIYEAALAAAPEEL